MINEWLSVNDDVTRIANDIADNILSLDKNSVQKIGKYTSIPFTEGSFKFDTGDKIGIMTVCYVMFHCSNSYEYDMLYNNFALNSGADNDQNAILIHSAFIKGNVADDFFETIAHEVNHLYQYANGFNKNVDLYDAVVDVLSRHVFDDLSQFTAMLVYYTFKHEVDSFATQFYHFLKKNGNINGNFESNAMNFKYYKDVHYMYSIVCAKINNPSVDATIKKLGLTKKQWKNRIQSGIKRFDSKLMNVYRRYRIESIRGTTIEGMVRRHAHLTEKYGMLEETIEPIYAIINLE